MLFHVKRILGKAALVGSYRVNGIKLTLSDQTDIPRLHKKFIIVHVYVYYLYWKMARGMCLVYNLKFESTRQKLKPNRINYFRAK